MQGGETPDDKCSENKPMKNPTQPAGIKTKDPTPSLLPSQRIGAFDWWRQLDPRQRTRLVGFLGFAGLLALAFSHPLFSLVRHAAGRGLHSHILLVPFISAFLIHRQWHELPTEYRSSPGWAAVPVAAALGAWFLGGNLSGLESISENDLLAVMALLFLLLLVAGGFLFLGYQWMAAAAFPFAFLIFLIPLPDGAVDWLETASKLASTETADCFFTMTRTPVLRDGTVFRLPGIVIQVAQECSGIRSSWVLFITGVLASHLFLKSPWRRVLLVAFVIPLGIVRNGFRILVIGLLCVHVGPHMIDSIIHHRGGPLFFVLSLIPLFILLWWLRRGDPGSQVRVI